MNELASADWYAVRVQGGKEFLAEEMVKGRGVAAVAPQRHVWRRASRYDKRKVMVTLPLLPRYLFVGLTSPGEWSRVLSLPMVHGVIGVAGRPERVRREQLERLMRRAASGAFVAPERQRHMRSGREFDVGQKVEIVTGPFEGAVVEVSALNGPTARVLLDLFGGEREAHVPVDALVAA